MGTSPAAYSTPLTALEAHQTYYYCAAASNLGGAAFGAVMSFTTTAVPPLVRTEVTIVDGTGALLNGAANPRGSSTRGEEPGGTTSRR